MPKTPQHPQLLQLKLLGQSGCRINVNGVTLYLDPYLSDSVKLLDSPDLERLVPIPYQPDEVTDADYTLITHSHIDHCDPLTLPILAKASPQCHFIGPPPVIKNLIDWGIDEQRLTLSQEKWMTIKDGIRVHATPAAHPQIERNKEGLLKTVGYLLEYENKRIYFAGDTSVKQELLEALKKLTPISTALLPVNEDSFFRRRRGIIGNMSIRDAFLLAEELKIGNVIPVHWDMFAANAAYPEEIETIYRHMSPSFKLVMNPEHL